MSTANKSTKFSDKSNSFHLFCGLSLYSSAVQAFGIQLKFYGRSICFEIQLYELILILTSGCGEPCPEHSTFPPVLLLNSILCGGSYENTGPCKSNSNVSARKENANRNETKILMTTPKLLITHNLNKVQMNAGIQCVHSLYSDII